MEYLPGAIKTLIIFGIIIAVVVAIPLLLIQYWYFSVPLAGAAIAGVVYWKRQKRASNMV